jgi:hypothetical protein
VQIGCVPMFTDVSHSILAGAGGEEALREFLEEKLSRRLGKIRPGTGSYGVGKKDVEDH